MAVNGRGGRLAGAMITVAVALGAALPAGALISTGAADSPSAKKLARGTFNELGPEALIGILLALDLGYTTPQIVEGMQSHTLVASGAITDENGMKVQPAGAPSGVLAGDDLQAPVSLDSLRTVAPDERRFAIAELIDILIASGRGYSPEDIIVEGLMNNGFGSGFSAPGVIAGVPRSNAPPDPDLLGDLLKGVKAAPGPDRSGAFVGTIELGPGWPSSPTPTVRKSKVRLVIGARGGPSLQPGEEILDGSYSFTVDAPGIVGPCSLGVRFTGTITLLGNGAAWEGTTLGDGMYLASEDPGCQGDQPVVADWAINVIRPSDNLLSGQMTFRALTVTFEASVPTNG